MLEGFLSVRCGDFRLFCFSAMRGRMDFQEMPIVLEEANRLIINPYNKALV